MDPNLTTAIVTAAATGGSTVAVAIVAIVHSNKRIDDLAHAMDARFASVDKRFDDVHRHIDDKFALLDIKLDRVLEIVAGHEERMLRLEGKR